MDILIWLMNWYDSHCDGDWEHGYGVKIETLDNPGWSLNIDLNDTDLEGKIFTLFEQGLDSNIDWIYCRIKDNIFEGRGDSNKLIEMLTIFKTWAES